MLNILDIISPFLQYQLFLFLLYYNQISGLDKFRHYFNYCSFDDGRSIEVHRDMIWLDSKWSALAIEKVKMGNPK